MWMRRTARALMRCDREPAPGRPPDGGADRVQPHLLVQRGVVDALVARRARGHLAVLLERLHQPRRVAARAGGGADQHQRAEALVDRRTPRVARPLAAGLVVVEPVVHEEVEPVDHRGVVVAYADAQQRQQVVQRVHVALAAAVQRADRLPRRVRREVERAVLAQVCVPGHQRDRLLGAALLRPAEAHGALRSGGRDVDGRGAGRGVRGRRAARQPGEHGDREGQLRARRPRRTRRCGDAADGGRIGVRRVAPVSLGGSPHVVVQVRGGTPVCCVPGAPSPRVSDGTVRIGSI